MRQKLHRVGVWLMLVWGMFVIPLQTYAVPSGEFATWTGTRLNWQINKCVRFRGTFQVRTQDGLKEMERGRLNLGMDYRMLSFLQLKGYYEIYYRNRGVDGWKTGHRWQAGFMVSGAKQKVKLSWRELLQQTFIGGTDDMQLRSRLRVDYEAEKWIVYPYFSLESFQTVDGGNFFSFPRVRYIPGIRWPFSHKTILDVYYCRQYDVKRCQNIVGITLDIKL